MKLYCFQNDGWGDYSTENGVAIANNEDEAWKLFFSKYHGYSVNMEELKKNYKIEKVLPLDKPVAWCGDCTN